MTQAHSTELPESGTLVCAAALHSLVEQLGEASAAAFVQHFVRLWPSRRDRLHLAVQRHDPAQGWDAALSLRSSATVAGALRLADVGKRLHAAVPASGHHPRLWIGATALLAELDRLGDDSVAEVLRIAATVCPVVDPWAP